MPTPMAHVEGPIPATEQSTIFGAVPPDLGKHIGTSGTRSLPGTVGRADLEAAGYVEEEYFVSGAVEGLPYRTSLLVRKPRDPEAFSGTVVVDPLHMWGLGALWMLSDYLMAHGHGYAMIPAYKIALDNNVKPSDPKRYASLDITPLEGGPPVRNRFARMYPRSIEKQSEEVIALINAAEASFHEAEKQSPIAQEILSQVGALVKTNAPTGPFAGLTVRTLVLGGASMTGFVTLDFIRDAHSKATMSDGSPIFDGYLPTAASGPEWPPARCDVPVINILSEGDVIGMGYLDYRRDDGDGPNDQFRLYEIAGASHGETRGSTFEGLGVSPKAPGDRVSQLPSYMYVKAALHNLILWIETGVAPPRAERILVDTDGVIQRDDHGNALGGVRPSHLDVPTATFVPVPEPEPGEMIWNAYGYERPFSKEKLVALYGTHDAYVAKVDQCLDRLARDRWLLPEHADELRVEAKQGDDFDLPR